MGKICCYNLRIDIKSSIQLQIAKKITSFTERPTKRLAHMDWLGTACQANVNGLIRFSVATDQSLNALLVVLTSQPVALHALALVESRNATLQVVQIFLFDLHYSSNDYEP